MTGYAEVARAESPRGEVLLRERTEPGLPPAFELRVNGVYVMDTQESNSERALASLALAQVEEPRAVVIGGLGLGATVHEVLADHRVEKVAVVEIEEALVGWMRDGTVPHGPAYLADERLTVVTADIRVAVAEATPSTYDLMLLDVDNGPDNLVHIQNASVYQQAVLERALAVLRPAGALAIWSASKAPDLRTVMEGVFGNVVAIPYGVELQGREEQYWLYLSRRHRVSAE